MQSSIEWTHVFAGTKHSPLSDTSTFMPHLPHHWVSTTRQYLIEADANFCQPHPQMIQPQHHSNPIIMDGICRYTKSPTNIQHINWCRLYLQVDCLSDICDSKGTQILLTIFKHTQAYIISQPTTLYPIQGKLGPLQWTKLRRFLKKQ
jgi:hypothetical protein